MKRAQKPEMRPPGGHSDFRIKKRQVAAYFNNGEYSQTVWNPDYEKGLACKKLVDAVNAARDAFNKIWLAKKPVKRPSRGSDAT